MASTHSTSKRLTLRETGEREFHFQLLDGDAFVADEQFVVTAVAKAMERDADRNQIGYLLQQVDAWAASSPQAAKLDRVMLTIRDRAFLLVFVRADAHVIDREFRADVTNFELGLREDIVFKSVPVRTLCVPFASDENLSPFMHADFAVKIHGEP